MWVPQWPLSHEKLHAAEELVKQQVQLEHLEPSTSPWNTPIFVIKKKSGKWRLLHDLRAVNAQMHIMGAVQRGLPLLSAIPKDWPIIAIDIQDCFFSIPLHEKDKERFAFTLPSVNHEQPDRRYQWVTLPQGMANSPTMCQLFVDKALQPIRAKFPSVRVLHYMDDILLAADNEKDLDIAFVEMFASLERFGLTISPEKIQKTTIQFLGTVISPRAVKPQKVCLRTQHLNTLNDFQQLLGDINWVRGYLPISKGELSPLYSILEGNPDLASPRILTPAARASLEKVERAISQAQVLRFDPHKPLLLCILKTEGFPTGVLWQTGPLWWLHGNTLGARTIQYYPDLVARQALLGIKFCLTHFGKAPDKLIAPYTKEQVEILAGSVDFWAVLMASFSGIIDNHYPQDRLLQFVQRNTVYFPKVTSDKPLAGALTVFTDGSKTGVGAFAIQGKLPVRCYFAPNVPQVVECYVVLEVFRRFKEPFNLISDSVYVVNAVRHLELAANIKLASTVAPILTQIQELILARKQPFYISHIRAHTMLPGPMAAMNDIVDCATRMAAMTILCPLEEAQEFHKLYHVSANTLRRRFHITREEARRIVKTCANCVTFFHPPHMTVNPRGLKPLALWQMDVTHISELGKLKYVHVSLDTYSGIVHVTPMSGEKTTHVKTHCLEAWAAWGKPFALKTDNGPAYTSTGFKKFCAQMQVAHKTGLPYNPQGQGMVERVHRTIKELLQKQKGGIAAGASPRDRIALALYTINFLSMDAHARTAADRHVASKPQKESRVMWKDVIDNTWYGPDPVLQRSRGAICVFPQNRPDPVWIPTRLVRDVPTSDPPKENEEPDDPDDPVDDPHRNTDTCAGV